MRSSQSGAAQTSILLLIFLIVIIIFLAGFTYLGWKAKAEADQQRLAAIETEQTAMEKAQEANAKVIELSEAVGFRDESSATAVSDLQAIKDRIEMLKGKYPDQISTEVRNLERVILGVADAADKRKRELDETKATLETEMQARAEAQQSVKSVEQQKDLRIQELTGQLSDEQQRSATQKDEDNQRIANLQRQIDELSNRVREVESTAEAEKQVAAKEISTLNARILALSNKLEMIEVPDEPDGAVLAAAPRSGTVYIDIGAVHGLTRGTKFDVFRYGKGGELIQKGKIEVRDVEEKSARCGITAEVDSMDPIVPGDVVANPLFARNQERHFVLLGQFPPSASRGFLSDRLAFLGYVVDEKVSPETDFLVLGEKEQGEFAPELTETDEYKMADKLGVDIVRLDQIWDFIRY